MKVLFPSTSKCIFILFFCLTFSANTFGQCKSFAKNVGKPKLGEFIHDGNYNATELGAGETAELYKTFFKGQRYRIAISKIESLPDIHFRLINDNNDIIFDNKDHNYTDVWDFEVESTQMIIIKIKVLDDYSSLTPNTSKGCVSVLFGMKKE
ncbi:hypothetical protein [Plebeiibacterium marinum]|uniref:Uncharacterized protein n=1 Tax=Plebeiibacterium marinum TaxID=2992111 RepID=A0AAE3SL55_9BACT|nr:hypothetical protein [Plebeiobacterium marinum]MCW3806215.1 hypothetical protein [Plebeiobacterium marinum]